MGQDREQVALLENPFALKDVLIQLGNHGLRLLQPVSHGAIIAESKSLKPRGLAEFPDQQAGDPQGFAESRLCGYRTLGVNLLAI